MIPREYLVHMALKAGLHMQAVTDRLGSCIYVGEAPLETFARFADMVAAHVIDRHSPTAVVLDVPEADLDRIKAWLVNAPNMPLVPMPTSDAVREAVLAEREAFAKELDAMADEAEADMEPSTAVANFRARAAAIRARGAA